MVLEIGSKLHALLVEQNAALIARSRSDHKTFNVYDVRGARFIIVKSGGEVEQIFVPDPDNTAGRRRRRTALPA